ncbi:MAG: cytochrome c [Chloroflexi bacterium]|nr:MAG: cytochrome c [Chloroflexota bacterium]
MTFPISRQGLEQIAIVLAVGAALFAIFAVVSWRRGRDWRRFAQSAGFIGALILVDLGLAYTVAPNIPTPPVPFFVRFLQNPTPNDPATVAAGRALYQANCAICHGPKGLGDGPAAFTLQPRPFNLQVHVPQHAPGELFYWISEGVVSTPMPPWKDKLTETERWEVVRYLQALAAGQAS